MFSEPPPIPALPAAWPYAPRPALPRLACRDAQSLPGIPGAWRTCLLGEEGPGEAAEPLGGAFGRGGVLRSGTLVMRPYRRGGLIRHLNERTYPSSVRFAAEFAIHRALWIAGFPTVEPIGYAWRKRGWGVEGVYLSRWTEATPWPRHWRSDGRILESLHQAIAALCAWGIWAPDLNATNVLVRPGGELVLLDWDRARFLPGVPLAPRYQARLLRSLRKLGAPTDLLAQFD